MRGFIIALIIIVIVAVGGYFFFQGSTETVDVSEGGTDTTDTTEPGGETDTGTDQTQQDTDSGTTIIGTSVEGRQIVAHHYGSGDTELLFVGGIHGGYEWNTVLLAYELVDYLEANPGAIPGNVKATVVPVLNPDGLYETVGSAGRFAQSAVPQAQEETVPGRFNANGVDLNRNFDCDWQSQGIWQDTPVDAGDSVFSEPESRAIRDYINANDLTAVVVYYSAVGGVFASNCHEGVLPETNTLTQLYADASGYPAYQEFNFYEITGDMVNWLAKENIPGISILLTTHDVVEWDKNRAGVEALLAHYRN